MAALDLTSFDAALKVHYKPHRIKNMVYKRAPLMAVLPKYTRFGGKNLPLPVRYGTPQGRSATFSDAQANKIASSYEDFVLTRVKNYSLASIDNETMMASVGDVNAFMRAAVSEIDGAVMTLARDLALDVYTGAAGTRGQVGSGTASPITLADTEDVINFEVGMSITASSAETSGARSGTGVITDINRDTGVITYSGTITSIAPNDYLQQEGDFGGSLKISGLADWLPASAPSAAAFFGVDRTSDTSRLGGIRYDGSSDTYEEALISASARLYREGGTPDIVVMAPAHYANLLKELGSKVQYDVVDSSDLADIAFDAVSLWTPSGKVRVMPDPNCPTGVAYMLQLDTWALYSLGEAPQILTYEGNRFLREATADSVEVRVGYYAQLGCDAPGWNCRITLPSLT